jgi:hypothetical protein
MGCLSGLAKIIKSLRFKKCHSSCCDIEIEGSSSPPNSPPSSSKSSVSVKSEIFCERESEKTLPVSVKSEIFCERESEKTLPVSV